MSSDTGSIDNEIQGSVGAVGRPPSHYENVEGLELFQVVDAFGLSFYEGNALKDLLRWRRKGGVEDLRKAKHYSDEVIHRES